MHVELEVDRLAGRPVIMARGSVLCTEPERCPQSATGAGRPVELELAAGGEIAVGNG